MLELNQLTAAYGSAQILNGVELNIGKKEVVALIGRNGVGKTTLLKTIMGIVPSTGGEVHFEQQNITQIPTYKIAKKGIGYVPQGRGIFGKLTVEENLLMGLRAANDPAAGIPQYLYEKFPILFERRNQLAGTLSGGQAQQLAISRALCSRPKILLLDEPSEGIQPNIVHDIGVFLRELVDEQGLSVFIVEQNLELIQNACDRFHIMVKGKMVHSGINSELSNEDMLKEYLSV